MKYFKINEKSLAYQTIFILFFLLVIINHSNASSASIVSIPGGWTCLSNDTTISNNIVAKQFFSQVIN